MASISNLGYFVLGVSDLPAWERFATGLLGMRVGSRGEHRLALRMDELAQRIQLERRDDDDLVALGWFFDTTAELLEYVAQLRQVRLDVQEGSRELARRRQVERLFVLRDVHEGFDHEFCVGPRLAPAAEPFYSPVLKGAGFVTGRLGVGHAMVVSDDPARALDFYELLGLGVSDVIRDCETVPGRSIEATFLHARSGRHHSLAVARIPGGKRIHHLMVEVRDMNDVGLAWDRCLAASCEFYSTLGHHPNDDMFSFYVRSPSGFGIEYGWGGRVIDRDWDVRAYSRLSDWGHQPPAAA